MNTRANTAGILHPEDALMHSATANDLCNRFRINAKNDPNLEQYTLLVRAAYAIAHVAHAHPIRESGEP
jgi:hypothetical protein